MRLGRGSTEGRRKVTLFVEEEGEVEQSGRGGEAEVEEIGGKNNMTGGKINGSFCLFQKYSAQIGLRNVCLENAV
jgi:hypothetical protein